jgi:spoIIIJ-associated protein
METRRAEPGPLNSPAQPLDAYLVRIESLVREIIEHGGFRLSVSVRRNLAPETAEAGFEAPAWVVEFSGADSDLLLERNAELLNALEYVVLRAVRLDEALFGKITFDCEDWRELRIEELKLMAQVAAERVIDTGDPFPLGPMNPRERRIIHLALREQPRVHTVSEGFGADRRVVIMPAASSPAKP